ncbi:CAP domain-containing protein [Rhodopirellula bahusiensis]|uniref:SCP domain-containing protein n=1 Tax=Rhodopirellula bahusiensis TaxID=2014065 RepID=A0A2G1W840_9BACT|nr:CAP domain-containing protein [Rhodopirellula bahusiensis]PHQ35214.1 hypothetical protein CEE69_12485 [Rhodopirellula bahusiensis]
MSRLFEASRLSETNSLTELVRGFVPRLFVPHLPALIAIGGVTCGTLLVTPTEVNAANGRVVQTATIPTGSGCTNCGQNRSVVTRSPVSSRTVSVGTPVQHGQVIHSGPVVHQGPVSRQGTEIYRGQATHQGQVIYQTSKPSVMPVSHSVPSSRRVGGAVSNVLTTLNAQRSRQGLRGLAYDPQLQAVAERRAQLMASTGLKTHPSGSFAPGRYEGVGWSSSHTPAGVSACYTSDPNMRVAGAAMARGRDGVYFCVVYR